MKKGCYLITGIANEQSLAWSIAIELIERSEECYFAVLPSNLRRVKRMLKERNMEEFCVPLDVSIDDSINTLGRELGERTKYIKGILHSVAYAPIDDLEEGTVGMTRNGFCETMTVSVYSLAAITRVLRPLLGAGTSIVTMTYSGSQKCIPGYNVMGVAKAGLESLVRYMAYELGPESIRVNAISAGPILTLSSSVFEDIETKIEVMAKNAPLRRQSTSKDIAEAALFLFSDVSLGITGQILYVDCGLSTMGN